MDPRTSNPRELMAALLPPARRAYARAWELLADPATPLERRRLGRERATAIAEDHALVAQALRAREGSLHGDDLLNARHLASELERHVEALGRIATISPIGMQTAKELRPESLGCGRSYRDPAKVAAAAPAGDGERPKQRGPRGGDKRGPRPGGGDKPAGGDKRRGAKGAAGTGGPPGKGAAPADAKPVGSRAVSNKPKGGGKGGKFGRDSGRPDKPRGPKVPRDQLGSTKHDSQLGDDLDPETRAKMEALRKALEG